MADRKGKVKVGEVVLDFDFYPRADVDRQHLHYMREAHRAGVRLPPIVVDAASNRCVDGFHRTRMYRLELGPDAEVDAVFRDYPDEAALFMDAMRLNANHGRMLSTYDRARCVLRAEELLIEPEFVASALSLTVEAVANLHANRVSRLYGLRGSDGAVRQVPIKRTIRHMSGRSLTKAQHEANEKLGGMEQLFYVNQLLTLIRTGLLDVDNAELMRRLGELKDALEGALETA